MEALQVLVVERGQQLERVSKVCSELSEARKGETWRDGPRKAEEGAGVRSVKGWRFFWGRERQRERG